MKHILSHELFLEYASKRRIRFARTEQFIAWACRYIRLRIGARQVAMALCDQETNSFALEISVGPRKIPSQLLKIGSDSPLVKWFLTEPEEGNPERAKKFLTSCFLTENQSSRARGMIRDLLLYHVDSCFKIEAQDKLAGYLLVGPREDGTAYEREDLEFMSMLAADMGLAIEKEDSMKGDWEDFLTGLPNDAHMNSRVETLMERSRKNETRFAAIFFDIAQLNMINQTYGHLAGDQTLRYVAESIRANVRNTDLAFRYGDDEFMAVLRMSCRDPNKRQTIDEFHQNARIVARRLIDRIHERPVYSLGKFIQVNVNASMVLYDPEKHETLGSLISEGEKTLLESKRSGIRRCVA